MWFHKCRLENIWNTLQYQLTSWLERSHSQSTRKMYLGEINSSKPPNLCPQLFEILVNHADRMDKIQRNFLWRGVEENKRYHLVAWDNVWLPKCYGGLGIRKIKHLNNALLEKQIWCTFHSSREWRVIMVENYLRRQSLRFMFSEDDIPHASFIWNGILKEKSLARSKAKWKVRMVKAFYFGRIIG